MKNLGDILENLGHSAKSAKAAPSRYYKTGNDKYNDGSIAEDAFDFIKLISSWDKIVGQKMTKNSLPLKVQGKYLVIITSHSIYNNQLQCFEREILQKINNLFPNKFSNIRRLTFKASQEFTSIQNSQKLKKENFEKLVSEMSSKRTEVKLGHQFDPDFQENYQKYKNEIKESISPDNEIDTSLEDAMINFNLRFRKR